MLCYFLSFKTDGSKEVLKHQSMVNVTVTHCGESTGVLSLGNYPTSLNSFDEQRKRLVNWRLLLLFSLQLSVFVIETLHTRSGKVLAETEELVSTHTVLSPEDKEAIQQRVKVLHPRKDALPAAALNKYKR